MLKRALFFFTLILSLSTGFSQEVWTIKSIKPWRNTHLITMTNGTVWKFQEDPGKTKYHTIYNHTRWGSNPTRIPYHVPGRNSNNINYFQDGDPILPCEFDDGPVLVFRDEFYENPIGCSLEEYFSTQLPTIAEIDPQGYHIVMSDGQEWTFSWWQSWASYDWTVGEALLPIELTPYTQVVNLDRLIQKLNHFYAAPY